MQTIAKWGNSLAVRIPPRFAETAGLSEGTVVDLKIQSGRLVVAPIRNREHKYDLRRRRQNHPGKPPQVAGTGQASWQGSLVDRHGQARPGTR